MVAEHNQGGDLVERTLCHLAPNLSVKSVHASRGKQLRAEPVSALYEQGRVHHVGVLADLEVQMTTWVPALRPLPDRVDALVYALTELSERGRGGRMTYAGRDPSGVLASSPEEPKTCAARGPSALAADGPQAVPLIGG